MWTPRPQRLPVLLRRHGVRHQQLQFGPSSQQSAMVTQSVTPRIHGQNPWLAWDLAGVGPMAPCSTRARRCRTLDATTGEFSGPMPPAMGAGWASWRSWPSVVASGSGSLTVTVDSVLGVRQFSASPAPIGSIWGTDQPGGCRCRMSYYRSRYGALRVPRRPTISRRPARFEATARTLLRQLPHLAHAVYPSGGWGRGWAKRGIWPL